METRKSPSKLLNELSRVIADRYPEGLVRQLEKRFRGQGLDVDGAVGDAIEIMVSKAETLEVADVRDYLYVIALNLLRKAFREGEEMSQLREDDLIEVDDALRAEVFKYVKGLLGRWENASLQATASVLIDAGYWEERLTNEELAGQLGDILGEEVSLQTVRKWKERALDRLADELRDQGFLDQ